MEVPPPHEKHGWLKKFVGAWRSECKMCMGEGMPEVTLAGEENVRAIGEYFIVGEGTGDIPGTDQKATMILTIGYDPTRDRFPGTWIGSMMAYHWVYDGELDASGKVLTLHAKGPRCDGEGTPGEMLNYRDIHTFVDDNHRILTGNVQGPDGQWTQMMEVHYYRK